MSLLDIFTARKRSLRRLCFYRCLSVHGGGACVAGGCAWFGHARWGSSLVRGYVWWGCAWQGAWGGMCGRGAGCAWLGGIGGKVGVHGDTINERAVRILLECILVIYIPLLVCLHPEGNMAPDVILARWQFALKTTLCGLYVFSGYVQTQKQ